MRKNTRSIVLTGLMIAIGLVIVTVLKTFGGQTFNIMFSPMHFPVLIAGLAIGPAEGLAAGVVTPILNYIVNGMPPQGPLAMACELGMYGLVTGLVMRYVPGLKGTAKMYAALVIAMILGRVAGGLVTGFILNAGKYSVSLWISSYFAATAPAIVVDLTIVPLIVRALQKAGLAAK